MREEAIAAVAAKHVPAATAAGMVWFGGPIGVLATAFLGAIISFYFQKGLPEKRIGHVAFGVVSIAFAGFWTALALPNVAWFDIGKMAAGVDASVRAGLCALVFQSLWNLGERFLERKVEKA